MTKQIKIADLCNELEKSWLNFSIPKIQCGDIAKYSGNLWNTQVIVIIHNQKKQTSFCGSS